MFDPTARIDELDDYLKHEYRVDDRQAVEILLGVLLPLKGMAHPWVILETDWLTPEWYGAWFTLGGEVGAVQLGGLRSLRPRHIKERLADLMEGFGEYPRVLVEPAWREARDWHFHLQPVVTELFRRCIRLRVKQPKSLSCLNHDVAAQNRGDRLKYLTGKVIRSELRSETPPRVTPHPELAYWSELTLKLAREGTDWSWLVNAITNTAVRHAALYNKDTVDDNDWQVAGRVMHDQIPVWSADLVRGAKELGAMTTERFRAVKLNGLFGDEIVTLNSETIRAEILRLVSQRVLVRHRVKGCTRVSLETTIAEHLVKLTEGAVFQPEPATV